ncbi:MAG TPA: hypothetical protein VGJ05_06155 [Fimbriiglobus sp.]
MIVLPRAAARAFRALARKCHASRPRGPAPPVTIRQHDGRLTLHTDLGEAFLTWAGSAGTESEAFAFPMALLDAVDGPGDDPVQIVCEGTDGAVARWADRGVPRTFPVEYATPDPALAPPEEPTARADMPSSFLVAMHEAGRTAAREPSRYALQRIQVRGKKGQIVGTNGKRAYLRSGFPFPFVEDVLVPAVPVFGARGLASSDRVRVGRTDTRLVVAVGPWTIGLSIDADGRFPDVSGVLPRQAPGVVGIDEVDAVALVDALPGLPVKDDETPSVTLDVDRGVRVRAGVEGETVEVFLTRSTFAGPPVRVALVRTDLTRLLTLGCRTLRIAGPEKPVVGEADHLTFAIMPLDEGSVVPFTAAATRLETDDVGRVVPRNGGNGRTDASPNPATIPIPSPEERTAMKPSLPPANPEPNHEVLDPLAEAEGLRNALADVVTRVARLVAALRHMKREKRALANVWSSLKDLHLGA